MLQYGLIGKKLGHSKSPELFNQFFFENNIGNASYSLFELESLEELPQLLKQNEKIFGLNVTIPYKEAIIPYLNKTDNIVDLIGAVNTVKVVRSGNKINLIGYNSDASAFEESLLNFCPINNVKALVLGNGGAAKAVLYSLLKNKIDYLQIVRRKTSNELTYSELSADLLNEYSLIINCTPLGMYPEIHTFPEIPYQFLNDKHFLYDLVYNPIETIFLKRGKQKGSKTKNGLEMLKIQAMKAWKIWTD